MKMINSKKLSANNKVIVEFNADKEKYLNYVTSANGDLTGHLCVCCHDIEALNLFGAPKRFKIYGGGGYTCVKFPEMIVLKEIASLKLLVDDEGQIFATAASSTLPIHKSNRHVFDVSIQKKTRRRQAYSSINIISHIFFRCQNYQPFSSVP